MVSETRDSTARIFDRVNDSVRAAFDLGRRTQEAWFKTVSEAWTTVPADGQRFLGEWAPFVGRQMETAVQAADASVRSGLDVFKAAVDATMRTGDIDPYESSRNFWDAAFGAARANFDVVGKAGSRAMEDCANFCESFWRQETPRRGGPTTTTKGPKSE